MTHILIIYATSEGQTANIAAQMVNTIREGGCGATRLDLIGWPGIYSLAEFDAVIIGASVHFNNYPPPLVKWIRDNIEILRSKRTAFYSVSMTAAQEGEQARKQIDDYLMSLFDATGWRPDLTASFAGAMRYSELSTVKQRVGQYVSRRKGGQQDLTSDQEFTNWEAVTEFTNLFLTVL